jgi:hypothetical protein
MALVITTERTRGKLECKYTPPAHALAVRKIRASLPKGAKLMIDLLLLHGEMNRNQLMAAMRAGKDVVRVTASKLNVAGLIVKNGGKFGLKTL